jgi:hypothetical protein
MATATGKHYTIQVIVNGQRGNAFSGADLGEFSNLRLEVEHVQLDRRNDGSRCGTGERVEGGDLWLNGQDGVWIGANGNSLCVSV